MVNPAIGAGYLVVGTCVKICTRGGGRNPLDTCRVVQSLILPRVDLGAEEVVMVNASVKAATALMEEALEILDSCEVLVPAVHLWTALQALSSLNTNRPGQLPHTAVDQRAHAYVRAR